jgi:transforming growth factor-beta-induced protein
MKSLGYLLVLGSLGVTSTALAQSCGGDKTAKHEESHVMTAAYTEQADIVDTAVKAGNFKTLAAALEAAGLVETLKGKGPFTVFAPTDEAFAKLPKGTVEELLKPENKEKLKTILTYHVVQGNVDSKKVTTLKTADTVSGQRVDIKVKDGKVMIDNATVTTPDVATSNGVIHVIDMVILPQTDNALTVAEKAGSFKTLAAAIKAAGLTDTLNGPGPFTIFAPTDEAFAKLPAGTLDELLKPENKEKLKTILTYHVVSGRVYADKAVTLKAAPTLAKQDAPIVVKDGTATIAGATITQTDIEASNAVIHVIDTVMLPKN